MPVLDRTGNDDGLPRSILVVEDEALLAMDVEMVLRNAGFRVVGPAENSARAMAILREETLDLTIVDLNLGAELAFSVFHRLEESGVPFIILSGHSRQMIPERFRDRPFLQKPYQIPTLLRMVREVLSDSSVASRRKVG